MITANRALRPAPSIGLEECRAHFTQNRAGLSRHSAFCASSSLRPRRQGRGGVYMWESQEAAERFYSENGSPNRARYGTEPKNHLFRDRRADGQGERTGERLD